jgi:hypothetical protein
MGCNCKKKPEPTPTVDCDFGINVIIVIERSNYPDTPEGQLAYELALWNKNNN